MTEGEHGHSEFKVVFSYKSQLHVRNYFAVAHFLDNASLDQFLVFTAGHLVDKKPLLQLLQDYYSGCIESTSWVILPPKVHPFFCNWWSKQMRALQSVYRLGPSF